MPPENRRQPGGGCPLCERHRPDGGFSIFPWEVQWWRLWCTLQKTARALERSSLALYSPWPRRADSASPAGRSASWTQMVACFTPKRLDDLLIGTLAGSFVLGAGATQLAEADTVRVAVSPGCAGPRSTRSLRPIVFTTREANYLGLCSLWYGRFPRTSISRRSSVEGEGHLLRWHRGIAGAKMGRPRMICCNG
jgi:hypothetical protein